VWRWKRSCFPCLVNFNHTTWHKDNKCVNSYTVWTLSASNSWALRPFRVKNTPCRYALQPLDPRLIRFCHRDPHLTFSGAWWYMFFVFFPPDIVSTCKRWAYISGEADNNKCIEMCNEKPNWPSREIKLFLLFLMTSFHLPRWPIWVPGPHFGNHCGTCRTVIILLN